MNDLPYSVDVLPLREVQTFVVRPMHLTAAALAMVSLGAEALPARRIKPVPVSWRPGEKRGPKPDLRNEVQAILRANQNFPAMWRHRFTGQFRVFDMIEPSDNEVRIIQFNRRGRMLAYPDGAGKVLRRSFSDALSWLRNAEEVKS